MKTITPKKTLAPPRKTVVGPRKTTGPRKAPVVLPQTARKHVASKNTARKQNISSAARKHMPSKNPARKNLALKNPSCSKSTASKNLASKNLASKSSAMSGKTSKRPGKGKKRRREVTPDDSDLSDTSGYSALEDVTDTSDDDDEEVEMAEEEHLTGLDGNSGPYLSTEDDNDNDELDVNDLDGNGDHDDEDDIAIADSTDDEAGEEDDEDEDGQVEMEDDEDHNLGIELDIDGDNESIDGDIDETSSWAGVSEDEILAAVADSTQDSSHVRKVRFDVPSSDSDSTDTDEEEDHGNFFPDLFIPQRNLDPNFRREIENDSDGSCSSGSFWDFNAPYETSNVQQNTPNGANSQESAFVFEMPINIPGAMIDSLNPTDQPASINAPLSMQSTRQQVEDASVAVAAATTMNFDITENEMDGYETDGDTTEEDEPEPIVRRRVRHGTPEAPRTDSETDRPAKARRGHPRAASFDLDKSDEKPIVVANPHSRKMMIFTPDNRRRRMEISPEQFDVGDMCDFDFFTSVSDASPAGTMHGDLLNNAFFSSPGVFPPLQGNMRYEPFLDPLFETQEEEFDSDVAGDEEEGEKSLNLEDFLAFEDDSEGEDGDLQDLDAFSGEMSPSRPSNPSNQQTDNSVLHHLTPLTVGSFRRNQIDKQLLFSSQASQDSLSFSGPYHSMALKGIKSGRFEAAGGVPLTPIRRRKPSQDFTTSPLDTVSTKRKATSEIASLGHKRQRSISDVTPTGINV
ncbi:hypothetical protein HOO65_040031 [Ceratocystis lukuohia]|uniref:Uncharacterized protein n=2 Tax=Ceratocystis TaxID=5157 RepID=A0A2C5X1M4_9PEZI|nr:hypothetical protein CFIMG_008542RA00001 [Ceratocystis fimbriata CBS 114723]